MRPITATAALALLNAEVVMLSCPIPIHQYPEITMAHGAGGRLMNELIAKLFRSAFELPKPSHDAAVFSFPADRQLAMTTDSFVVSPLTFPGGSIGSLAVYGTVNDLAMAGARARYLTLGVIAEEGLPMETLWREVLAIRDAAARAGVRIVTGDTKVVERGKGDGLYLNTAGVGVVALGANVSPARVAAGDAVIVSGDLGRHGVAVMVEREGLMLEEPLASDCAPLVDPAMALLEAGIDVHCMRDLTRGGLVSALVEIAGDAEAEITIEETAIEVLPGVEAVCELLGLDPLYVANEGRFVAFVPESAVDETLSILSRFPDTQRARRVGSVAAGSGQVVARTAMGTTRILDMLAGAQLPRIC